jgi:hypothetical protein
LYKRDRTSSFFALFSGLIWSRPYNRTDFRARFSSYIYVILLGIVSEFLLLEIVFMLLICTFLTMNKISLIGFPQVGVFLGWVPKILGVYMDL